MIERFSEDIDVVIDRDFLGFGEAHSPETATSGKQRARRLEDLMVEAQRYIRESLRPEFEARVGAALPAMDGWRVEMDMNDPDQQTVLFRYPTTAGAGPYLQPTVKIELGARSDVEPAERPDITPYVAEVFPAEVQDSTFSVRTVAPERTFWEKVALLHEEGYRASNEPPKARLARHYYDIWSLIQAGVSEKALADPGLFERVVEHRKVFFKKGGEAQSTLRPGSLRLVPTADRRPGWKRDYDAMREAMFFGEPPTFDTILAVVGGFEQRLNHGGRA